MTAREATAAPSAPAVRWRLRDIVLLLPKIVLTGLLILAIGDLIVGVFLRYVMVPVTDWLDLDPVNFFWVEEVGEYSLAWLTMIGAGIGVAERAHFTLRVLTHRLPLRMANTCGTAAAARARSSAGVRLPIGCGTTANG